MADGTTQGGTAIVAGDEITTDNGVAVSARQAQRVKVDRAGVDGAFTDVSPSNPFPTVQTGALPTGANTIGAVTGSGNFAITAASLPLPTGASTETTLAALNTKIGAQGQALMAASTPVVLSSNHSAIATNATLQAGANVIGALTANQSVNVAQMNGVAVTTGSGVTGTGVQRVVLATDVALPTGANSIGTTPGPTLTKGTQGTVGHSVQDLKDAGRVIFSASTVVAGVTAVTAEAMLTMTPVRDGVAGTAATTFAVTANKRLRISLFNGGLTNTTTTAISCRLVLRYSSTGAVTTSSPILTIVTLHAPAAVAQTGDHEDIIIPDGVEFNGTMQIGISQVASATTGTVRASVVGFEY